MRNPSDDDTMTSAELHDVNFVCKDSTFTIQAKDGFLHIKCTKNLKVQNPSLLSAFDMSINLLNVVSVTHGQDQWRVDENGDVVNSEHFFNFLKPKALSCCALLVHFLEKQKNHCRRLKTIKLQTRFNKDCIEWTNVLKQEIDDTLKKQNYTRPCSLLMIVNPFSGNKKGKYTYDKVISPLLKLAGITETVVVTQHKGHAKEFVESADLTKYDGVIAVGGDGTFSEVVNGVLIAEQRKHNILLDGKDDIFNKPISYSKASIKVGVIPVGTGNILSYTTQGISDPETATLQIICGESHPLDVCSVFNGQGKLASFSLMGISYGFISQVIQFSDQMRMFGSAKTLLAFMRGILNLKSYAGEVSYLTSSQESPVDVAKEDSRCRYPCQVCLGIQNETSDKSLQDVANPNVDHLKDVKATGECELSATKSLDATSSATETTPWKICRGRFVMIASMNTAGMFAKAPKGASPSAHLADGTNDLALIHPINRRQFLEYLKAQVVSGNCFDLPYVEVHRIIGMRFRALSEHELAVDTEQEDAVASTASNQSQPAGDASRNSRHSCWTSDGEFFENVIMENQSVTLWVHKGLVNVFAKGVEENQ